VTNAKKLFFSKSFRIVFMLIVLSMPVFPALRASAQNSDLNTVHAFSEEELSLLRSLSLSSLPPLPKDPSNAYADNPKAVALGKKFFFDPRFSANGEVSCASCHEPATSFTDLLPLAKGMGINKRRSMPLIGSAYNSWFFWDGRKDSLWSQAIGPIENSLEHGLTRTMCAHLISDSYPKEYEAVFGRLPKISHENCPPHASPGVGDTAALEAWKAMNPADREQVNRIYVNFGKAIAAFVRQIVPQPAPFDRYVEAVARKDLAAADVMISRDAVQGLRIFIGKGNCTNCHLGPLFTNGEFHDIGLNDPQDQGRAEGIGEVMSDEFNCLGKYSDAKPEECAALRFIDTDSRKYIGTFKTPTLRNVADRPPYMHAGQFATLDEVLFFYERSFSREVAHQRLSRAELQSVKAFLHTLSGPLSYPK
jgi:cytochrome c peroxidase